MPVILSTEGAAFITFVLVLGLAFLVIDIWALIDAAGKPDWAWRQAGSSKVLYLLLIILGFFLCGIVAFVTSIVYLSSTRQRLNAAMGGGGSGASAGYGQAGVWQQPYGQPQPATPGGAPAPGWWLASDGNWYPPPRPQDPPTSAS